MKVVKLGGSLLTDQVALQYCLQCLEQSQHQCVIVPGGGVFADLVRQQQQCMSLNDRTAHRMALLAMQQTALVFQALEPDLMLCNQVEQIKTLLRQSHSVIWNADIIELDQDGVAASWDVTSDSLAAWLALKLKASELYLVKSAQVPDYSHLTEIIDAGLVDKGLEYMLKGQSIQLKIINKTEVYEQFAG